MRDLRKIKAIALLMSVMTCILMFSVGFSAWFKISAPAPVIPDEDGSFEAYDVLTIHMQTPNGMEIFEYSALSFRNAAGESTSNGQIKVHYVVPKSTVDAANGNFTVDVTLTYETLSKYATEDANFAGLFAGLGKGTGTNQVSVTSSKGTVSDYTVGADNITAKLTFEDITLAANETEYAFTLTYDFNIPPDTEALKGNFRQMFGKYLNVTSESVEAPTKFIVTAQVTKTPAA
jgi:hypothetical protein